MNAQHLREPIHACIATAGGHTSLYQSLPFARPLGPVGPRRHYGALVALLRGRRLPERQTSPDAHPVGVGLCLRSPLPVALPQTCTTHKRFDG